MKLRVIGWVEYDEDLPTGDNGWAARNAIIDDIRKNDYEFTGWDHQERTRCTPVLNDGKKYCYSQRGWGDVMAEAHGLLGSMDYAKYMLPGIDEMFALSSETKIRRPKFSLMNTVIENDLNETFKVQVTNSQYQSAANNGVVGFFDYQDLRYLYKGDTLVLACGDQCASYLVTDVVRIHIDDKNKQEAQEAFGQDADELIAEQTSEARAYSLMLKVSLSPIE